MQSVSPVSEEWEEQEEEEGRMTTVGLADPVWNVPQSAEPTKPLNSGIHQGES